MSSANPYAPPKAHVADIVSEPSGLASRGSRLGAALLDTLIAMVYTVPIYIGLWKAGSVMLGKPMPWYVTVNLTVAGFILFALVHGYFLKQNGQTLGKKMLGIRIVAMDGSRPGLGRILGLRYLPVSIAAVVPFAGPLLALTDVLFIFRADRRCVHDLLAGTKVVAVD